MNRMILTGQPYVSDYLVDTIIRNRIKVIDTPGTRDLIPSPKIKFIGEDEAADTIRQSGTSLL